MSEPFRIVSIGAHPADVFRPVRGHNGPPRREGRLRRVRGAYARGQGPRQGDQRLHVPPRGSTRRRRAYDSHGRAGGGQGGGGSAGRADTGVRGRLLLRSRRRGTPGGRRGRKEAGPTASPDQAGHRSDALPERGGRPHEPARHRRADGGARDERGVGRRPPRTAARRLRQRAPSSSAQARRR